MKKIKKILALLMAMAFVLSTVACAAADGYMGAGPGGGYYGESFVGGLEDDAVEPSDPSEGGEADGGETEGEEDKKEEEVIVRLPSGMITAGAWNDNDNYSMWLSLFSQGNEEEEIADGKFYSYVLSNKLWDFNSLKRVKVSVTNEGTPVSGATVVAFDNQDNALFTAVSDAQGNAYLFVTEDEGKVTIASGEGTASAEFTAESRELSVELSARDEKLNVVEIMFVVDVTGSMGDEINFLKAELADVINKIAAADSETVIKLALLFYRDLNDKVPFYYCDFIDVTDPVGLELRISELEKQFASGGGDYEEAVDEALEMAVEKQWSTGNTTKLIFHVLDAPAHSGKKYETRFNAAVLAAAQKGIRICPILCSGAAELTEYTMRQAAIYTGGTFIFVTDDSGIGGSHHDPNLPNVTVELLNSMLVRLVKGYHTGEFEEPIYWRDDPALATQDNQ